MLEKDFLKRVTDMADRFGWKWWHVPAPMINAGGEWRPYKKGAGVADLILTCADPPRLVFIELKGDGGKLTDNQRDFLQSVKDVAEATSGEPVLVHDRVVQTDTFSGGVAHADFEKTLGVYAFWPEVEPLVEQLLRTKVLLP